MWLHQLVVAPKGRLYVQYFLPLLRLPLSPISDNDWVRYDEKITAFD